MQANKLKGVDLHIYIYDVYNWSCVMFTSDLGDASSRLDNFSQMW